MMNVSLICLGRLKEDYLRQACGEYEKRLGGLCRFNTEVLEPERLSEQPSEAQIQNALDKEGDRMLKRIPKGAFVTAMCIEGKELNSPQLALELGKISLLGHGSAVFLIGSSYGLSDRVKNAAQLKLSMSKMTFPHQLARVMLMEQLYRAFCIIENKKYHK